MMVAIGALVLLSFSSAVALQFLDEFLGGMPQGSLASRAILTLLGAGTSFLVVLLVYRFVPNTPVTWADVWPAALLVTLTFEGGKRLFLWYVETQALASYSLTYGPLAAVMVLLLWVYLSAVMLLAGAEMASEYRRLRSGGERGVPLPDPARKP
jgi:membrane protein